MLARILLFLLVHNNCVTSLDIFDLANDLRSSINGQVYLRGSPEYESARPVHNGACRHIFPALIASPKTTTDVSLLVQAAVQHGLEISVRGGGHSFQCQGIKSGSLHIDMRAINRVKFVSNTAIRMGAGATFKQVLSVVDPAKYTILHGQAKNVGVGGFLLGVGVNPIGTTPRYGYGADHVLEYTMVLADGSVALVNDHNTTIVERNGKRIYEAYEHTYHTNLRYAMRGSGASFGIVTDFLYKIYPEPETLSCILLVQLENGVDMEKLNRAGMDGRYALSVVQPFIFRRPKLSHLMAWALIKGPQVFKWKSKSKMEPVLVSVVDLRSRTKKTDCGQATAFMEAHGLQILNGPLGLDGYDLALDDQEAAYLTKEELRNEGYHAMASANMNGLTSFKAVQQTFLHHPEFGMANRATPLTDQNLACDFCLWILYIAKPGVHDDVIADTKIGHIAVELDCTYNPHDRIKSRNCPKLVKSVKREFVQRAKMYGEKPHQYVNTPDCEKQDLPFGPRYWGNGYERLLKIKKFWDPHNVFHYCHSLGSTEEQCCIT